MKPETFIIFLSWCLGALAGVNVCGFVYTIVLGISPIAPILFAIGFAASVFSLGFNMHISETS